MGHQLPRSHFFKDVAHQERKSPFGEGEEGGITCISIGTRSGPLAQPLLTYPNLSISCTASISTREGGGSKRGAGAISPPSSSISGLVLVVLTDSKASPPLTHKMQRPGEKQRRSLKRGRKCINHPSSEHSDTLLMLLLLLRFFWQKKEGGPKN